MTNQSLEARIQLIEDRRAIEHLVNEYHKRADAFDWAGWSETIAEDGVLDFPTGFGKMSGRKNIHDTCKASMDHVYEVMQHVIVNLDIEVNGDTATGTANLLFTGIMKASDPTKYYQCGGRYKFNFQRTPQGWLIGRYFLEFIWNNGGDADSVFEHKDTAA